MKEAMQNWLTYPTKKQVGFLMLVWLFASLLSLLAMTNLFDQSLFQLKNIPSVILIFGSAYMIMKLYIRYKKNR